MHHVASRRDFRRDRGADHHPWQLYRAYCKNGTPSVVHTDTLGRPFLSIAHNKDLVGDSEYYTTRSVQDIQGHLLEVIDARDNTAESRTYGMLGQSLVVSSVDAGDRHALLNALGQFPTTPCADRWTGRSASPAARKNCSGASCTATY